MKSLFLLTLNFLFLAQSAFAETECNFLFSREILNTNARTEVINYVHPNARDFDKYKEYLGEAFAKFMDTLEKGKVWIDGGGGFGIASLMKSLQSKVTTYVINAQDNWQFFREGGGDFQLVMRTATSLGVSLKDIPKRRNFFDKKLEIDLGKARYKHSKILRSRILQKVEAAGKLFNYIVGFVEERISEISEQADVISDLFGGFFYSANRVEILDLYYEKLKPSGMGFVKFKAERGGGVRDVVWVSKKRAIPLAEFLVETYPDIFSYDKEVDVLVIKKNQRQKKINLVTRLTMKKKPVPVNDGGMDIYQVDWIAR